MQTKHHQHHQRQPGSTSNMKSLLTINKSNYPAGHPAGDFLCTAVHHISLRSLKDL